MNRENFKLTSVKLANNGGVEATYTTQKEDAGRTHECEFSAKETIVAHPDLKTPMYETGRELLFRVLGFDKANKGTHEDYMERISCFKVTIKGKEDKRQAIVSGKLETNGTKISFNSPLTKVESNGYGIDLTDMIDALESETYEYLFKDKKAQLDISDQLA